MQASKAGFIEKAQERKDDAIRISSTARDATLIITTFYSELSGADNKEEIIKELWIKWRKWFYNRWDEEQLSDKAPF